MQHSSTLQRSTFFSHQVGGDRAVHQGARARQAQLQGAFSPCELPDGDRRARALKVCRCGNVVQRVAISSDVYCASLQRIATQCAALQRGRHIAAALDRVAGWSSRRCWRPTSPQRRKRTCTLRLRSSRSCRTHRTPRTRVDSLQCRATRCDTTLQRRTTRCDMMQRSNMRRKQRDSDSLQSSCRGPRIRAGRAKAICALRQIWVGTN